MVWKMPNFSGWNKSGTPAYEKLDDDEWGWWVSLDSTYVVETLEDVWDVHMCKMVKEKVYTAHPESEKPLYSEKGNLNRWSFRWTDDQVHEHYNDMMEFKLPA